MWHKILERGRRIDRDERGLEAMQILMIIAIAGVSLIAVKLWWGWYAEYLKQAIEIFVEN